MAEAVQIRAELRNAWTRKLGLWWRHYNREYLAGALREPLIRLSEASTSLGRWDGDRRLVTIAERHVAVDPWPEVLETLRHEMAHQYAEEVLGAQGERPHGSAFDEACRRLRCGRFSGRHRETLGAGEQRILRRIRKVLSLVDSPNEFEAQAAVGKARELLVKYSIDLAALDGERDFSTCCLGPVRRRRLSWELWLACILKDFFFVEVLWAESYEAAADRLGTVLQVHGTAPNLKMAAYVYDYLSGMLDRLWREYRLANGIGSNRERQRYFGGVMEGFYAKLEAHDRRLRRSRALVWKGDVKLEAFYRYLNPRVETRYWGGCSQSSANRAGFEEGGRISLRPPVEGKGGAVRGLLPDP